MYLWSCFDEEGYVELLGIAKSENALSMFATYLLPTQGDGLLEKHMGGALSKEIIEKIASKEKLWTKLLRSLIVEDTDDEISDLVFEKTACFLLQWI